MSIDACPGKTVSGETKTMARRAIIVVNVVFALLITQPVWGAQKAVTVPFTLERGAIVPRLRLIWTGRKRTATPRGRRRI